MADQCSCGCGTMTVVTNAEEECGCGCACCATTAKSREDEIAELRTLRESIERRLAELETVGSR